MQWRDRKERKRVMNNGCKKYFCGENKNDIYHDAWKQITRQTRSKSGIVGVKITK